MTGSVLFVCLGNICRSATAEAVMRAMAPDWRVDSAGTGAWHIGEPPDRRMQTAAKARGYDLSKQRARQVSARDFETFERIIVMDRTNLRDVEALRPDGNATPVALLLDYGGSGHQDLPDPYYEGGFDEVITLIETALEAMLSGATKAPPAPDR